MSTDPTIPQGGPERRQAKEKSLERSHPPTQVPGYEPERFLGVGAYGEVWVAVEKNTGRRVAIKFYTHSGGLDWSLLSREVEKLAFLFADRYVVQLIGVGWDSDPPYYIMEHLEQGSLAKLLEAGTLPVAEAVDIFRDVAVGLVHAHGKGVLHCDLKPANILLDQDGKPRLADFGQSRLSHEQAPALGTLFYMAPEQADLQAVPDARWDVYALGALLYSMLTGAPPHRSEELVARLEEAEDLPRRLSRYRRGIRNAPVPVDHRPVDGVDRALAEIIERCLAADPQDRYPTVQAVLAALDARAANRARRPAVILGGVGPPLVLLVVSLFAWAGFSSAVQKSEQALTQRAQQSNRFAARFVAKATAYELDRRYQAVEQLAASARLQQAMADGFRKPDVHAMLDQLSDPESADSELEELRLRFRADPDRKLVQQALDDLTANSRLPEAKGWFLNDSHGVQVARVPENPEIPSIGKNFAWRTYYTGLPKDQDETWRPGPDDHLKDTTLSAVYQSRANRRWMAAISHPIFDDRNGREFLGFVALMVEVGDFVELPGGDGQFAVLVDQRQGDHNGLILQHPLYDRLLAEQGDIPERLAQKKYRVRYDLPAGDPSGKHDYRDPLAADPEGGHYDRRWLAQLESVRVRDKETGMDKETGLAVIVQEPYDEAIGSTLADLRSGLVFYGLAATGMVVIVVIGLWTLAIRLLKEASPTRLSLPSAEWTERTTSSFTPESPTDTHQPKAD